MYKIKGTLAIEECDEELLSEFIGDPPIGMIAVAPNGDKHDAMLTSVEYEIGTDDVILEFDMRKPKPRGI